MNIPAKISLSRVTKSFGSKHVLRGIDMDIAPGESVVVIGGSGTGKSVLLKCILGLIGPDAGTITVDGEDTTHLKGSAREAAREKFGMLFQNAALFDSLPVWENVAFGLMARHKTPRNEAKEIAIDVMGRVGLKPDAADLSPAELSGGMQKRVGLARAIAQKPEIIFFDEPTTGLDPIMADVINDLIRSTVTDLGVTALSITHDMASARKIADNITMLYEGQLIWRGPASEVMDSGNAHVDQFVHGRGDGPITDGT